MSAERSPDVRRSPPENNFGGSSPDPRGTGRSPRVSARIRAEPRRKVLRRANCQLLSLPQVLPAQGVRAVRGGELQDDEEVGELFATMLPSSVLAKF